MTYDHEMTLISHTWEENEIGVQIPVETKTTVLCGLKSISRDEFYSAAVTGLKPEMVFVIHECEYGGERELEFEGGRYRVLRTYRGGMARQGARLAFDEMELTCERMGSDG